MSFQKLPTPENIFKKIMGPRSFQVFTERHARQALEKTTFRIIFRITTTLLLSEDAICYWVKSFRMREAVKIKTLWPVVNTFVPAVGLLYENVNNDYSFPD